MLLDGIRRPRADLVISASSPPLLLVTATLIAARHRAKSIHWIMDLYPEIAVALGEIPAGLFSRTLEKVMSWCYGRSDRVIALDTDMADRLRCHGVDAEIIRPWVFSTVLAQAAPMVPPDEPWTWIYSGNLGRAHEWETLLRAQALLEERGSEVRLLFQGGGPSWPAARARAAELKLQRCEWRDYVPEQELHASLLRCRACTVTQLPPAQGLLWPSKLGFVMTLPRPILWIGPVDGAIARTLRELPHVGIFAPGDAAGVAGWLQGQCNGSASISVEKTFDAAAHRAASLQQWRELVAKI
jgi:glycosyltransferase involved in cell wall biosynthesis